MAAHPHPARCHTTMSTGSAAQRVCSQGSCTWLVAGHTHLATSCAGSVSELVGVMSIQTRMCVGLEHSHVIVLFVCVFACLIAGFVCKFLSALARVAECHVVPHGNERCGSVLEQ